MKEKTKKMMKEQIKKIMEEFDFKKVLSLMKTKAWFQDESYRDKVKIEGIKKTARMVMEDAVEMRGFCSTGGFTAIYLKHKHKGKKYYGLQLFWGEDSLILSDGLYVNCDKD